MSLAPDIFLATCDGRSVATVALPIGFRAMGARGDRVVGVVRDELGVERVHVYGVARAP